MSSASDRRGPGRVRPCRSCWPRSLPGRRSAPRSEAMSGGGSATGPVEIAERGPLPPRLVKILRGQPGVVVGAEARPFAVEDREPGGVAVASLADHVLVEDTLEA